MNEILTVIDDFVWGVPLIVLILAVGILLTVMLKGLQITKLPLAVKHIFANDFGVGTDVENAGFRRFSFILSDSGIKGDKLTVEVGKRDPVVIN